MTKDNHTSRRAHAQSLGSLVAPVTRLAHILAQTPDQAEDLAQDALARVWAHLAKGGKIKDLRPYLMTTLRNSNRHRRMPHQELTDEIMPECLPRALGRIACKDVNDAICNLKPEQQSLLRALFERGVSYKRLAQQHDLPIGTVMSRIARARAQLRREMGLKAGHAVEELLKDTF